MPSDTPSPETSTAFPRDRFDDLPADRRRVGAHRAEQPRLRGGLILLWSVVAVVVIVSVGIVATLSVTGRLGGIGAEPTATSQVVAPAVDTSYPVLVLNATDESGLGETVRQQLLEAGWAESYVEASNASANDFPTTTVYYGAEADEAAARGLADVIGGADVELDDTYQVVTEPSEESGDADAPTQLVVIVGLDFRTE